MPSSGFMNGASYLSGKRDKTCEYEEGFFNTFNRFFLLWIFTAFVKD